MLILPHIGFVHLDDRCTRRASKAKQSATTVLALCRVATSLRLAVQFACGYKWHICMECSKRWEDEQFDLEWIEGSDGEDQEEALEEGQEEALEEEDQEEALEEEEDQEEALEED